MVPGDENCLAFGNEIAELSVLLSCQLIQELEQAAHERGVTAAQLIRRLIQDFVKAGQRRAPRADNGAVRQWA
ncbi:MAG TPA: hypothetical protein VEL76_17735 [Gemmataceae bacterium]|nr:hypothetical protein [Gemmataceae bacterium]